MGLLGGPKESCKKEEEDEEDPLKEKLKSLEQEWSSFKQSSNHHPRRCSTDSDSNVTTLVNEDYFDQLVMNNNVSPRQLMSSLQLQSNNNGRQINDIMVIDEILEDRWDESGKLKGRRLFEEEDSTVEYLDETTKDDLCSEWSSSSSVSVNQRVERQVVEKETEIKVGGKIWLAVMAWLGVLLAMYMLSRKCNGDQGHVNLLVPT